MFNIDWSRPALTRVGLLLVFAIAGLCALAAIAVGSRCSGDGTFSLSDPMAHPSSFCRATALASFPDSLA
jgi:hypothetical protein